MGDFLPWTQMNRRVKFDAASFILVGEIHNRTNKQKTQTVIDIYRPCLSACQDNNFTNNMRCSEKAEELFRFV